jgi:hypothetical protein
MVIRSKEGRKIKGGRAAAIAELHPITHARTRFLFFSCEMFKFNRKVIGPSEVSRIPILSGNKVSLTRPRYAPSA